MTPAEIESRFDLEFERLASAGAPGYEQSEKSDLLTTAMEQLISNRYNFKSNPQQYGFEETEKRIADLNDLVKYKTYTTFVTGFLPNSYTVQLPNTLVDALGNPDLGTPPQPVGPTNYNDVAWFIIYEACTTNKLKCNSLTDYEKPMVKEVNHSELESLLDDPFNAPTAERNIFRNRYEGRTIALITDGTYQPTSYTVGYIKKPTPVALQNNVGFVNIPDHLQREIITNAVYLGIKALGDSRVQINKPELLTIE